MLGRFFPPLDLLKFQWFLSLPKVFNVIGLVYDIPIGQGSMLQSWLSESEPLHGAPPLAGSGLLQVRFWVCVPFPHVLEQLFHPDQSPQLPSYYKKRLKTFYSETFCNALLHYRKYAIFSTWFRLEV